VPLVLQRAINRLDRRLDRVEAIFHIFNLAALVFQRPEPGLARLSPPCLRLLALAPAFEPQAVAEGIPLSQPAGFVPAPPLGQITALAGRGTVTLSMPAATTANSVTRCLRESSEQPQDPLDEASSERHHDNVPRVTLFFRN
jgi:hypothetical protein